MYLPPMTLLLRSPIKAVFALATIFSLLISSSKAHESSESCLNETSIVQSNASVASAIEAAMTETLSFEPPSSCSSRSLNPLTCSYDFQNTTTSSDTVDSLCTAAGGQYVVYDFSVTCNVTALDATGGDGGGDTTNKSITYVFTNAPNCIGASCDASTDHENVETYANGIIDMLNNNNSNNGTTSIGSCGDVVPQEAAVTSAAPTIRGAKNFLVVLVGTLLASTFLF